MSIFKVTVLNLFNFLIFYYFRCIIHYFEFNWSFRKQKIRHIHNMLRHFPSVMARLDLEEPQRQRILNFEVISFFTADDHYPMTNLKIRQLY